MIDSIHLADRTLGFVPVRLDDGREFIPAEWCVEHPEIEAFAKRFPDYWEPATGRDGWVSKSLPNHEARPFLPNCQDMT